MSDKYKIAGPDNMPPAGKEDITDAKGEKLLQEPSGKCSEKYENSESLKKDEDQI